MEAQAVMEEESEQAEQPQKLLEQVEGLEGLKRQAGKLWNGWKVEWEQQEAASTGRQQVVASSK